jgi:hypothetical protein
LKILYIDCFAGISGNSFLGALLDAGFDETILRKTLLGTPLGGYSIKISREKILGIDATHFDLQLFEEQPAKSIDGVLTLINKSNLPKKARDSAVSILTHLAEAKARAQNIPSETVSFSGKDTQKYIITVIGLSAALNFFAVEKVIVSPVTLELLKEVPAETNSSYQKEVLITELGAAIIKTLAFKHSSFPAMTIEKVGYGIEKSPGSFSKGLRLIIGTTTGKEPFTDNTPPEKITVLETNIDDMNPELYPYLIDRLLKAGALDAFITPIIMKGGRPATTLTVLGGTGDNERLADIIFQETTTLGIRTREEKRITVTRHIFAITTGYGVVKIKTGLLNNRIIQAAPEYKDCRSLAEKNGVPLKEVYAAAQQAARDLLVSRETSCPVTQHDGQNPS